jgi:hypothetical protein
MGEDPDGRVGGLSCPNYTNHIACGVFKTKIAEFLEYLATYGSHLCLFTRGAPCSQKILQKRLALEAKAINRESTFNGPLLD